MNAPRALLFLVLAGCTGAPAPVWKMPTVAKASGTAPSWAASDGADASDSDDPRGDVPESGRRPLYRGMWLTDEARARAEARKTHRALLVDFSAEWCTPCMLFQADTFSDELVQNAITNDFVPLRIDVTEESREGREQLRRYGIRGLPAVLVMDAQGHEVDRIEQYLNIDAFLARLAEARARLDGAKQAAARP